MNELRNLLLDCRAALRRADVAFDDGPLRPRLDKTIITMSMPGAVRSEVAEPPSFTAQQVAYAWQQAARELHFSHPALYAELGERVRERLQDEMLVDPSTDLLRALAQLREARAAHAALQAELAALHAALADAVMLDGAEAHGSDAECAQRRLALLVQAATRGLGLPKPRATRDSTLAPSRTQLQLVADGAASFSPNEREWCIGEAVARTAFARTPEQLLADGDRALAQLLLEAG
ncbi:MAG: hypothetical protein ACJ8GK_04075 [Luteimonas sp.]